ncbi:hypothetical protein [Marinobacterium weihaiense]|uniref:Uncharacterized protein n=1 Tax=Marinobacterium weihaiense TaxID=2851016 RepID=A0ABS6M8J8_9GAMM|nr:hypothetical protein [Marinobacterium weihaiense]MBV0932608.1 hypothetical protein [Marinobacterium weihaiense]
MSNDTRHPDIEIYIKGRSLEQILDWLRARCDSLTPQPGGGGLHAFQTVLDGARVPVMINEKAVGKAWTSVWFRSDATPWQRDLDCAEEAARSLQTQVRCIVSGWQDGDDPDEWWKIEDGATEKITWRTE